MSLYLALGLIAAASLASFGLGDWRRQRHGKTCYRQALVNIGLPEYEVQAELDWWWHGDDDQEADDDGEDDDMRAVPGPADRIVGDDRGGEGAPGVLAGGPRDPVGAAVAAALPSQAGYRRELAAIGGEEVMPLDTSPEPIVNVPRPGGPATPPRGTYAETANGGGPGHTQPEPDRGIFADITDDTAAFALIRWGFAAMRDELRRPYVLPAWPSPMLEAAA